MARPPNLFKRLGEIIKKYALGGYTEKPTTHKGKPPVTKEALKTLYFSRRKRAERPTRALADFRYIQDVLSNMPAADNALWQLADDVSHDENGDDAAFSINVKVVPVDDSDEAIAIADKLREELFYIGADYIIRTGIGYKSKLLTYKFLSAGDCFAEQVVSINPSTGFGVIEDIRELPGWQMHVVIDDQCNVLGYEQKRFMNDTAPITWEIPQQIIHWRYRATDYFPYGSSALEPLQSRWEQFKLMELDLLVAAHTRAVDPEVHKLGREGSRQDILDEQVLAYKAEVTDDPTNITRRYVVKRDVVEIDFPKTGNAEAIRVLFQLHRDLEDRFVEALGVSGHIQGNVKDVAGRHISKSLDSKHARKVASLRGDFTHYVWPSVLLEYALHGFDLNKPEQYGVSRIMLEPGWFDIGESRIEKSKRVIAEVQAGLLDFDGAVQQLGHRNPLELRKRIKDDRENELVPNPFEEVIPLSNNGEQGRGVPGDGGEEENLDQVE